MSSFERRFLGLCRRINAEKIELAVSFDRASWWQRRRAFNQARWHVVIEWENENEKFRASGVAEGLDRSLSDAEAEVNGILLRNAPVGARHDAP